MKNNRYLLFSHVLIGTRAQKKACFLQHFKSECIKTLDLFTCNAVLEEGMKCIQRSAPLCCRCLITWRILHLTFFLAMSNSAEERRLCWSTGGKTIPLGFALPVSSQMRQKQRKIKGGKKSLFSEWDVLGLIRVWIKAHLLDYLNIHF